MRGREGGGDQQLLTITYVVSHIYITISLSFSISFGRFVSQTSPHRPGVSFLGTRISALSPISHHHHHTTIIVFRSFRKSQPGKTFMLFVYFYRFYMFVLCVRMCCLFLCVLLYCMSRDSRTFAHEIDGFVRFHYVFMYRISGYYVYISVLDLFVHVFGHIYCKLPFFFFFLFSFFFGIQSACKFRKDRETTRFIYI